MRKTTQKRISVVLAVCLLATAAPSGVFFPGITAPQAQAASEAPPGEAALSVVQTAEAQNPLAEAVANAVNAREEQNASPYSISDITLSELTATVQLYAPAGATVLVAVFNEEDGEMVTSGKAVCGGETFMDVSLAYAELPEYYIIKGFLLDGNNAPIGEAFTVERFTRRMQEFYAITPADFSEDHILFYENDANFAAAAASAIPVACSDTANTLVSADHSTGVYTFSSADDTVKGLQPGETFFADVPNDIVIGTVTRVETAGNAVTVYTDTAQDPLELFDYIHVDTSAASASAQNKAKAKAKADNEEDDEHNELPLKISKEIGFSVPKNPTELLLPADWKNANVIEESMKVETQASTKLEAAFKGVLTLEADLEYCAAPILGKLEYLHLVTALTYDTSVTISLKKSGSFTIRFAKLDIPTSVPGLFVFAQASLTLSASGQLSGTGNLKFSTEYTTHREGKNSPKNYTCHTEPTFEPSFSVEASVNLSATLELAAGIELLFGVIKADAYAKLNLSADIKPLALSVLPEKLGAAVSNRDWTAYPDGKKRVEHDCTLCVAADLSLTLSVGLETSLSLKKEIDTEDYRYVRLDSILDGDFELCSIPLKEGRLRFSICNGEREAAAIGKDEVCPHMRFLTEVKVTQKGNDQALEGVPVTLRNDPDASAKIKTGANVPAVTTVYTDVNGEASCFLPIAMYSYDIESPEYKLVSSNPSNTLFRVKNDAKFLKAVAVKKQTVSITVVNGLDGTPCPNAYVEVDGQTASTDANGKTAVRLFPVGSYDFTVTTAKGTVNTVPKSVNDATASLTLQVYDQMTVTLTAVNKYDEPLAGAVVKAPDGTEYKTDKHGVAVFMAYQGESSARVSCGGQTVSVALKIRDTDIAVKAVFQFGCAVDFIVEDANGCRMPFVSIGTFGKTDINGACTVYLDKKTYESVRFEAPNGFADRQSFTVSKNSSFFITLPTTLTWSITGDTLTVSGTGSIPREFYKKLSSDQRSAVKNLVIQNSVLGVGDSAFRGLGLNKAAIPGSCFSIGEAAFYTCRALTDVQLSEGLMMIGPYAFCSCGIKTLVLPGSLIEIGDHAFDLDSDLTTLVMQGNLERIGDYAFSQCHSVSTVRFSERLKAIGSRAFYRAFTEETDIVLPGSLKTIEDYAFCESNIKSVRIPGSVETIGTRAFWSCKYLTSVVLDEGVKQIGEYAFASNPISSVALPDSLEAIGLCAFSGCYGLETIQLPSHLKTIGGAAFSYCNNLKEAVIPDSVTDFGGGVFVGCKALTSVRLPDHITEIGVDSFKNCASLTSIKLPASLKVIGDNAFEGCDLRSVTIPAGTEKIGNYAFFGNENLKTVALVGSLNECGENVFYGTAWANDHPDGFLTLGSVCFGYKGSIPESQNGALSIPASTTIIARGAFCEVYGINKVYVPEGVVRICDNAFYNRADLTEIYLPRTIRSFGENVFAKGLAAYFFKDKTIYYSGTEQEWDAIPNSNLIKKETFITIVYGYSGSGRGSLSAGAKATSSGDPAAPALLAPKAPAANVYTVDSPAAGVSYIVFAVKDAYAKDLLFAENLLWVDQRTAGEETLSFTVAPRGGETAYEIVVRSADLRLISPKAPEEPDVPGDVDGDERVTAADARLALRAAVGLEDYAPGSREFLASDVDADGGITAADARLILRAAVGLEDLQ